MSSIFAPMDAEEKQNAIAEAINDASSRKESLKERQDAADKKDEAYNQVMQPVAETLGGELIRRPIEKLAPQVIKKGINAVKKRIAGGLKDAVNKGADYVKKSVSDNASRLGVNPEDLEDLRTGNVARIGQRAASRATSASVDSGMPSSDLDSDTRAAINKARVNSGLKQTRAPEIDTSGEPVEIDAFSGKPITRQVENPNPVDVDNSDWAADLYDSPITQSAGVPTPRSSLFDLNAPSYDEPMNPTERFASSRLQNVFKDTDLSDVPSVNFKAPPRVFQPQASGDSQALDQLAPLRAGFKGQGSSKEPISSRRSLSKKKALEDFRNSDGNLKTPTTQEVIKQQTQEGSQVPDHLAPEPDNPASSSPDADPVNISETSKTPPVTNSVDDAAVNASRGADDVGSDAAKAVSTTAEDVGNAGKNTLTTMGEIEAAGGGPEDPLADIGALVFGLGSLFGGIFGAHHHTVNDSNQVAVNAANQQGVM